MYAHILCKKAHFCSLVQCPVYSLSGLVERRKTHRVQPTNTLGVSVSMPRPQRYLIFKNVDDAMSTTNTPGVCPYAPPTALLDF